MTWMPPRPGHGQVLHAVNCCLHAVNWGAQVEMQCSLEACIHRGSLYVLWVCMLVRCGLQCFNPFRPVQCMQVYRRVRVTKEV